MRICTEFLVLRGKTVGQEIKKTVRKEGLRAAKTGGNIDKRGYMVIKFTEERHTEEGYGWRTDARDF